MSRITVGALAPGLVSLIFAIGAPATSAFAQGLGGRGLLQPARTACDVNGRCYETGDPGYRDDDAPPPHRRYEPDDGDRPPPPRHRYDPGYDDRPPSPRRRYDGDDDDRPPPPPPRRRYDPDGDN